MDIPFTAPEMLRNHPSNPASQVLNALSGLKENSPLGVMMEPFRQANVLRFSGHSMSSGFKHNPIPPKQIKAFPAELDFGDKPICICHLETISFVNVGDHVVEFNTVVVDSAYYHHSFTRPVTVAPKKKLTIQVVFLPAAVEEASAWLYLQTSVSRLFVG